MKQILFSCVGTTDPIRGEHDGPMLHIVRHYRPEEIFLFISEEIAALEKKDSRFDRTIQWISSHWEGYSPVVHKIYFYKPDVHDIDVLDQPLHEAVSEISNTYKDAEILINLTSGTPQMQMILSQLAMDMRYHTKGIQVRNYESKSGSSPRTNIKDYDIELELEFNEDELSDAKNRCEEPLMYAIRREFLRRQIFALLDQRNFEAIEQLTDSMPENLLRLIQHLSARSKLKFAEAKRLGNAIEGLPFKLYPYKTGSLAEYNKVVEYYLLMKNQIHTGHFTEFVLHMEPLIITLQQALLQKFLQGTKHSLNEFIITLPSGKQIFKPERLKVSYPDLYKHYNVVVSSRNWCPVEHEINTYICDDLLSFFSSSMQGESQLFQRYNNMKDLRNRLAHNLCTVTNDAEIKTESGAKPDTLLAEIENTITQCYPACDPVMFSVYEKCIDYIKSHL